MYSSSIARNAIDVHCHGVGRFDFTELSEIKLQEIEDMLAERGHRSILTLYLPQNNFEAFFDLISFFAKEKQADRLEHIAGFGLEGPLLASHGGTPHKGVWNPTKREWQRIASAGSQGLLYVIFSPDALLDKNGSDSLNTPATSTAWIAETLLEGGVLPAAGHFLKNNPKETAACLQTIYDVVAKHGYCPTVTDHLYNDMPHNFKHAWRTLDEKNVRDQELSLLDLDSWTLDNIEEKLGIVPATMIRNAKKGLVKIAQNFDGEHVDLSIIKKTVELIGAENMLMMTDSIESKRLAGRALTQQPGSSLLYQDEGIVAAGSLGVNKQIENMLAIGLTPREIDLITRYNPELLLAQRAKYLHAETQAHCI